MPFTNYSLTKNGQLTIGQIRSPDFVHGVSGWSVNKDGSAEFHDIIIPAGSGGTVVTFAATAPAGPNAGDVWYNTADGLEASVWNGSSWTPYQISTGAIANSAISTALIAANAVTNALLATNAVATANIQNLAVGTAQIAANAITAAKIAANTITAGQIAANTITAAQLAAGIVYAGIVDSTTINSATINGGTFNGTNWIEDSTGSFYYSSSPALGNLAVSIVPGTASVTDPEGNTAQPGVTSITNGAVAQLNKGEVVLTYLANTGYAGQPALAQPANMNLLIPSVSSGAPSLVIAGPCANATALTGLPYILMEGRPATGLGQPQMSFGNLDGSQLVIQLLAGYIMSDAWNGMTLSSGWTLGGGGYAEYKRMPDNTVAIRGEGLVPGTLTNGTHLWTIPSGYIPTKATQPIAAIVRSGTAIGTVPRLEVTSTGTVNIEDFQATASSLFFSGRYALD